MKKYKQYNRKRDVSIVVFNEAIHKKKLIQNTDDERKHKAKYRVKTRRSPLNISSDDPNTRRTDFIVKDRESTEKRTHHGFIDHDRKTQMIHSMFCDCNDFGYRLYSPFVKAGLSSWDIPKKYKKRMSFKHAKDWTDITNKSGEIYVCKHLFHMLNYI